MSPICCFSSGLDDHGFLTSPSVQAAGCWYEMAAPGITPLGYSCTRRVLVFGTEQLSRTWLNSTR